MAQPAMEERIAHLEGRVEGFGSRFDILERRIDGLGEKIDRFREELSGRIDALDAKVDRVRDELSGRIDALSARMERHFQWNTGLMVGLWSTVVLALVFRS